MNSQLEKAIQEAMVELDRVTSPNVNTSSITMATSKSSAMNITTTTVASKNSKTRLTRATAAQQRKLIKIAPAPPNCNKNFISCLAEQPR